jgi:hypothetical protein
LTALIADTVARDLSDFLRRSKLSIRLDNLISSCEAGVDASEVTFGDSAIIDNTGDAELQALGVDVLVILWKNISMSVD